MNTIRKKILLHEEALVQILDVEFQLLLMLLRKAWTPLVPFYLWINIQEVWVI